MTDISQISQPIATARRAQGLSQQALAQKLGIRQSQISDIEAGKRDFRLSTLIEVARAVGLELVLVQRSLLPAVNYVMQTQDRSHTNDQQSIYQSWKEEDVKASD